MCGVSTDKRYPRRPMDRVHRVHAATASDANPQAHCPSTPSHAPSLPHDSHRVHLPGTQWAVGALQDHKCGPYVFCCGTSRREHAQRWDEATGSLHSGEGHSRAAVIIRNRRWISVVNGVQGIVQDRVMRAM